MPKGSDSCQFEGGVLGIQGHLEPLTQRPISDHYPLIDTSAQSLLYHPIVLHAYPSSLLTQTEEQVPPLAHSIICHIDACTVHLLFR